MHGKQNKATSGGQTRRTNKITQGVQGIMSAMEGNGAVRGLQGQVEAALL